MKWAEFKSVCSKHGITIAKGRIKFCDIPATKKYFKRRPIYTLFVYNTEGMSHNDNEMKQYDGYLGYGKKCESPIVYYKPTDLYQLEGYKIDGFMEKGCTPTTLFRRLYSNTTPINTVEEFEAALKDLFDKLDSYKRVMESSDLEKMRLDYKNEEKKVVEAQRRLNELRYKFRQVFKKQASLIGDF